MGPRNQGNKEGGIKIQSGGCLQDGRVNLLWWFFSRCMGYRTTSVAIAPPKSPPPRSDSQRRRSYRVRYKMLISCLSSQLSCQLLPISCLSIHHNLWKLNGNKFTISISDPVLASTIRQAPFENVQSCRKVSLNSGFKKNIDTQYLQIHNRVNVTCQHWFCISVMASYSKHF